MCRLFHRTFLLLGSNQGNKKHYIEKANCLISRKCGEIVTQSSFYFSESWGYDDEDYLNQAIELRTFLSPQQLLNQTQGIEKELGRTTKTTDHYQARPIDIDILFYENCIIENPNLTLPHPRLHLRNFVLQPLKEIIPDFVHPTLNKTITDLYEDCTDMGKVWQTSL